MNEASIAPEPSYRALLAVPWLPRILISMQLARIAQSMVAVAIVLFTLKLYGSPAITGIVTLASVLPGIEARPAHAIALAEGALLGRLDRMMLLLTLVVLVLSGLCLVTMLMSMVVEREPEIGLARAIGAGDGEILGMFLGEVGLLGVIGALAGSAFGAILVRVIGGRLFGAAIEPRLSIVPAVLLASLLICLAAVLVPLRRALSIQPAAALRGD